MHELPVFRATVDLSRKNGDETDFSFSLIFFSVSTNAYLHAYVCEVSVYNYNLFVEPI